MLGLAFLQKDEGKICQKSEWRQLGKDGTLLCGILNVTPDSFFRWGALQTVDRALEQARKLITEGATYWILVGESHVQESFCGEIQEEIQRVGARH